MCFTRCRQWCRLWKEGTVFMLTLITCHLSCHHMINNSLVFCSSLVLVFHVPKCPFRLPDGCAVAKHSTAGTQYWGVIWGLLAIHSAVFPALLSATLPSHQICFNVCSKLWVVCSLSATAESLFYCCAILKITGPFSLEGSSRVETRGIFRMWMPVCLFPLELFCLHQG